MSARVRYVLSVLAILAVFFLLYVAVIAWSDGMCEKRGGHMVATMRDRICVGPDGRIL